MTNQFAIKKKGTESWQREKSQPVAAYYAESLAVDEQGDPAFVDKKK